MTTPISRTDFIRQLRLAALALNAKGIIPQLQNFYFDEESVSAFSGRFVITSSCLINLSGGISGQYLLGVLEKSRARTVEIDQEGSGQEVRIKLGASLIRFPLAPPYDIPTLGIGSGKMTEAMLTEEIIHVFEQSLINGSDDPSLEDRSGVLCWVQGGKLECLTTDNRTLSHVTTAWPGKGEVGPISIPADVVQQVIRLWKTSKPTNATLGLSTVGLQMDLSASEFDGQCRLTAVIRSIPKAAMDACTKVIDRCLKNKDVQTIDIPHGLQPALDRALVLSSPGDPVSTSFSIEGNILILTTTTPQQGEIIDRVKIGKEDLQPIQGRFDPSLVSRALKSATRLGFSSTELSLSNTNFLHLIAVMSGV